MNNFDKVSVSLLLVKRAGFGSVAGSLTGGDTGFEHTMGGLSYVPGIGFLGNLGQGASQLVHGHPWKALGNLALGTGSFFTGGLANDAIKGGIGATRLATGVGKAVPTFAKGFGAANNAFKSVPKSMMSMRPFQSPGFQNFAKAYPSQWVSGGQIMNGTKPFVKNVIGGTAVRGFTDHMDYNGMGSNAGRDQMFNTLSGAGGMIPRALPQSADPRWLTPNPVPGAFSPMFN